MEKYDITDAELEIMQILWEKGKCSFQEITIELEKTKQRSKSTIKTLLYRLVDKDSVRIKKIGLKDAVYEANISYQKYLSKQNQSFLDKLYKGSAQKLLLNFVEEKAVSKEELQKMIQLLESED